MWDFVLQRAKAIAAFAAPAVTVAIIEAACKTFAMPFPDDARTWTVTIVASIVAGTVVHQVAALRSCETTLGYRHPGESRDPLLSQYGCFLHQSVTLMNGSRLSPG